MFHGDIVQAFPFAQQWLPCSVCNHVSPNVANMFIHLLTSLDHFTCHLCLERGNEAVFDTNDELEEHLFKKHSFCFECWKPLRSPNALVQHNLRYHQDCRICGKEVDGVRAAEMVSNVSQSLASRLTAHSTEKYITEITSSCTVTHARSRSAHSQG